MSQSNSQTTQEGLHQVYGEGQVSVICRARKKNSTCQWASESSVSLIVHLLTLLVLWESCKELKEQVCLYCLSRKMCRGIMS